MINAHLIDKDTNFQLYSIGKVYKQIKGLIHDKNTNEIFEGIVTLYKYYNPLKYQWEYEEDIYEAIPYPANYVSGDVNE